MLKLNDAFGPSATSNAFISHSDEPINLLAVGTWDGNTLTVNVNPNPNRESWTVLYQAGSAVTMTATDNMKALVLPGGVYVRLTSTTDDGGLTDLNLWVGGPGVTLVSGEV